jgi:phosphoribosylamine-glycine ligase
MSDTVLLLGSGSREHAIAWKLLQSPKIKNIYVAPGNGGIKRIGDKVKVIDLDIKDNASVIKWCQNNKPQLVLCGPEDPLDRGIANDLKKK